MAFLTIAGVNYDVSTASAEEKAPRMIGKTVATFAGGMRSTRRLRKRVYGFTLGPMARSTYEQLVLNVGIPIVTVTGDALNGASFSAIVDVEQGTLVDDLTAPRYHQMTANVTITEV